ncbi:uncharacterized protein SAPINGB_P000108 [Magnusiomyces paraingens]|uniref:Uncharacterized protein n=1 Tax=Magnusiomyces paraingens TaxID=2606893 RepID=A0A5E8B2V7_9ASCO|nr:uncharacterized protein SAPINGB_P000108 [Saprochaete ingens]VVT43705.1 unnamed protein product [Saprochaete ingens]
MSRFIIDKDGCAVSVPTATVTRPRRAPEASLKINVRSGAAYLASCAQESAVLPLSRYTAAAGAFHSYQHETAHEIIDGLRPESVDPGSPTAPSSPVLAPTNQRPMYLSSRLASTEKIPRTMHAKYAAFSFSKTRAWLDFYAIVNQHLHIACEDSSCTMQEAERRVTEAYQAQEEETVDHDPADVGQLMYTLTRRAQLFLNMAGTAVSLEVLRAYLGAPDIVFSALRDEQGGLERVPVLAGVYTNDLDFAPIADDFFFHDTLASVRDNDACACKGVAAVEEKKKKTAIDIVFRTFEYMALNNVKYTFISTASHTRFLMRPSTLSRALYVSPAVSHFQGKPAGIFGCLVAMCLQAATGYPRHWLAAVHLKAPLGVFERLHVATATARDEEDEDSILDKLELPATPEDDSESNYSDYEEDEDDGDELYMDALTSVTVKEVDDDLFPETLTYPLDVCPIATPAVHSLNTCHVTYPGKVQWWKVSKARKNIHTIRFLRNPVASGICGASLAEVEVTECEVPPEAEQEFRRLERNETCKRLDAGLTAGLQAIPGIGSGSGGMVGCQGGSIYRGVGNNPSVSSFFKRPSIVRTSNSAGSGSDPESSTMMKANRLDCLKRRRRSMVATLKTLDTSFPGHVEALELLENEARIYEYFAAHATEARGAVPLNYMFGSVLGFMFVLAVEHCGRPMRALDFVVEERVRVADGSLGVRMRMNEDVVKQMHEVLDVAHSLRLLHGDVANLETFVVEEIEESVPNLEYYFYKKDGCDESKNGDVFPPNAPPPSPLQKSIRLRVRLANFSRTRLYVRLYKAAMQEEHEVLDAFCKETYERSIRRREATKAKAEECEKTEEVEGKSKKEEKGKTEEGDESGKVSQSDCSTAEESTSMIVKKLIKIYNK